MYFNNNVGRVFAGIFGNFSITRVRGWGQMKRRGMQTPSFHFARLVHFLTAHAAAGMNTFFCGFPSADS